MTLVWVDTKKTSSNEPASVCTLYEPIKCFSCIIPYVSIYIGIKTVWAQQYARKLTKDNNSRREWCRAFLIIELQSAAYETYLSGFHSVFVPPEGVCSTGD